MELTPVESGTLIDLLPDKNGDNVPGNIGENLRYHEKSVARSLPNLEDKGLVRNKGRGVWTLIDDGLEVAREIEGQYPQHKKWD